MTKALLLGWNSHQGPLRCRWSRVGSLQSLGQVGRRKGQAEGHYQQPCPLFYPPSVCPCDGRGCFPGGPGFWQQLSKDTWEVGAAHRDPGALVVAGAAAAGAPRHGCCPLAGPAAGRSRQGAPGWRDGGLRALHLLPRGGESAEVGRWSPPGPSSVDGSGSREQHGLGSEGTAAFGSSLPGGGTSPDRL